MACTRSCLARSSSKIRSGKKRLEDPPKRDNQTGLKQNLQLNMTVSFHTMMKIGPDEWCSQSKMIDFVLKKLTKTTRL